MDAAVIILPKCMGVWGGREVCRIPLEFFSFFCLVLNVGGERKSREASKSKGAPCLFCCGLKSVVTVVDAQLRGAGAKPELVREKM